MLLGVCAPDLAGRRLTIDGRRVQALRCGRVALLVAYVDQAAYAPAEIERRRSEPAWFAAEARLLERAVERAGVHGRVLPVKPLTAFADAEALETYADEHVARWSRALARLGGKRECAVHLFVGPHAAPGGAPYVARVAVAAGRHGRVPAFAEDSAVSRHALAVWRDVTAIAIAVRTVRTGNRRSALWSAVILLEESEIPALATVLERSAEAGTPLGVSAYLEAPRAPFTFV